jgi:hypothetical protein
MREPPVLSWFFLRMFVGFAPEVRISPEMGLSNARPVYSVWRGRIIGSGSGY